MDEGNSLIQLPYGENFKICWESYVKFMKYNNKDTSIKEQNQVLKSYTYDSLNEKEAINRILSSWKIVNEYFI